MPGTQALPRRRGDGSLSLYSDEKEDDADKYSVSDHSADRELEDWVKER